MMPATFSDATAESREEFLDLVRGAPVTFYEVYAGLPNSEMEALFDGALQDGLLLRFDMRTHSETARARFCEVGDVERRAYDLPSDAVEKPLPYFGSFVPSIGHVGVAWTSDEVRQLIARTKRDVERAKQVAEFVSRRGTG
jgi:hypothetical protein